MTQEQFALVYRLIYTVAGQEMSPSHIWGTVEAIASMGNARPVYASERQVVRSDLDAAGFIYEHSYAGIEDIQPQRTKVA